MEILTTRKQKAGKEYKHRMYFCSNAKNRGPAVCTHSTKYKADELEADLLAQYRAAMTPRRDRSDHEGALRRGGRHAPRSTGIAEEDCRYDRPAEERGR